MIFRCIREVVMKRREFLKSVTARGEFSGERASGVLAG
jgi:hypothetical protein